MKRTVIILSILALIVSSCGQTTRKQEETVSDIQDFQDTLIIKHKNILTESEDPWYSKSYSYYWLVGKDTLDFSLRITESKRDSTLRLRLSHRKPILFADALRRVEACLPLIKEDFNMSKITSFHFMETIFYLDLAKKLSGEYEQKFGRKNIGYTQLYKFLLESSLTSQLNHFFNQLNKKVKRYGIEKFHLIEKRYYKEYVPNADLTEYPEFTINGYNGVSIQLENK